YVSMAIARVAFPLPDRACLPHVGPELFPPGRAFPDAQLDRGAAENFIAAVTGPVQEGIVHQRNPGVAHAVNGRDDWAGMKRRAKARFALSQSRLAGSQLRFGLFPLGNVERERQDVRHAVELDHFRRQEHRGLSSAAIAEADLTCPNRAGAPQMGPKRVAIFLALPDAKLGRVS